MARRVGAPSVRWAELAIRVLRLWAIWAGLVILVLAPMFYFALRNQRGGPGDSEAADMAKAYLLRENLVSYGCEWEFPQVTPVEGGWWKVTAQVTDRYENTHTYTVYAKETGDDVWSFR